MSCRCIFSFVLWSVLIFYCASRSHQNSNWNWIQISLKIIKRFKKEKDLVIPISQWAKIQPASRPPLVRSPSDGSARSCAAHSLAHSRPSSPASGHEHRCVGAGWAPTAASLQPRAASRRSRPVSWGTGHCCSGARFFPPGEGSSTGREDSDLSLYEIQTEDH
jgi:hypothetical protein